MRIPRLLDDRMLEERRILLSLLVLQLDITLRAKRRVGGNGDAMVLAQLDQPRLQQVRVVFDLQGLRGDAGVAQEVEHALAVVVGDADALDQLGVDELLKALPGLLQGGLAEDALALLVDEFGGVFDRGVVVLQGDGEVDQVEVEVVEA